MYYLLFDIYVVCAILTDTVSVNALHKREGFTERIGACLKKEVEVSKKTLARCVESLEEPYGSVAIQVGGFHVWVVGWSG